MEDRKDESVMSPSPQEILVPTAEQGVSAKAHGMPRTGNGPRRVIGLLNNSKPNVNFFLETIDAELAARFPDCKVVNFVKPRSAGPCPELDEIAEQCDFAINAVADCGSRTARSGPHSLGLEKRGGAPVPWGNGRVEGLGQEGTGPV